MVLEQHRTGLWRCQECAEVGGCAGLRPDVVCASSYFFSIGWNNTSKRCPEGHLPSDDLDLYGHWEWYFSDVLVTTSSPGLMAETCLFPSTCKLIADILLIP